MAKKQTKFNISEIVKRTVGDPSRNPKQELFLQADKKYVAYGGARGGGKSFAVRYKAILLAAKYAGIKILIIRRTLSELRENHTIALRMIFAKWPAFIRPKYNDDEKAFMFTNGSRIRLGYCDSESDVLQYQGQEYDVIFLDEATQLTEYQFSWLDSCLRGVNDFPKRMYLTCNPGGVGHAWVRRLFIDKEYRQNEIPDDYGFIEAKVWDNEPLFESDKGYQNALRRYIHENNLKEPDEAAVWYAKNNADYVIRLKNMPYHLREAWLNGRWDVFAGQYFGEFDREVHTCEPFVIPKHWRKSLAIDYGLDMLAVVWVAVDEHGNAWVYRELNEPNLAISLAADAIKRNSTDEEGRTENLEAHIAPPDLWNRQKDTGVPMAETFAVCGIPLIKSGNDRIHGWLNLKEWLKPLNGKSRLVIFRTCQTLIKNIPLLQHDENKPNDVSTQPHDITHAPDALRYWCSRRQLSATAEAQEFKPQFATEIIERDNVTTGEVTEDYIFGGY